MSRVSRTTLPVSTSSTSLFKVDIRARRDLEATEAGYCFAKLRRPSMAARRSSNRVALKRRLLKVLMVSVAFCFAGDCVSRTFRSILALYEAKYSTRINHPCILDVVSSRQHSYNLAKKHCFDTLPMAVKCKYVLNLFLRMRTSRVGTRSSRTLMLTHQQRQTTGTLTLKTLSLFSTSIPNTRDKRTRR